MPEIWAVRKRPGEWFLTADAKVVLDDDGLIVFLGSAPECTRYAQERFGVGISNWLDASRFVAA